MFRILNILNNRLFKVIQNIQYSEQLWHSYFTTNKKQVNFWYANSSKVAAKKHRFTNPLLSKTRGVKCVRHKTWNSICKIKFYTLHQRQGSTPFYFRHPYDLSADNSQQLLQNLALIHKRNKIYSTHP